MLNKPDVTTSEDTLKGKYNFLKWTNVVVVPFLFDSSVDVIKANLVEG